MELKDLRAIAEAYNQVYSPQKLTEEVEIAAQYFYEMGLNENGVDILIEELGVDEFAEFVYDISEEYVLTEARAGGVKIEPVTASGKPFKSGKPTGRSLQRLRDKKAARRSSEEKASSEKPSGLKASLQRQTAIASAKKQQPKKKGVLDRIAGVVNKGIEAAQKKAAEDVKKRKEFMSAARETGKTIRKAAGKVGGVAKEVGKGASGAAKLAGHVASKGLEEESDIFDIILEYLVSEGYAETNEAAIAIMVNMSEEWRDEIMEEFVDPEQGEAPSGRSPLENVANHPSKKVRKKAIRGFRNQMSKEYGGNWKSKSNDGR